MAAPLQTSKPSVDLASSGVPGSRIRRDPAPTMKELVVPDRDERDARMVVVGVIVFALAIVVASLGLMASTVSPPKDYVVKV